CESTTVGKFTSYFNLLHGTEIVADGITKYVFAPIAYGLVRLVKEHFFGIVPVINCFKPEKHFDINDSFERIQKRFNDLNKAIDKFGHLPLEADDKDLRITRVQQATERANHRSWFGKRGFSMFSEARTVLSLG